MLESTYDCERNDVVTVLERRKFQRINTYLPVRLRLEESGRYVETLAKDVSLGGLRCVVEGYPAINEPIMMELPLYKEVMPLQVRAKVAWVRSVLPDRQCVAGVRFEELTSTERLALAEYLERLPVPLAEAV